MVAMAMVISSLKYPIATMISHRVERIPNKLIRVQMDFSRVLKRKNYLRRKILKTLTKPHNPIEVIEPSIEFEADPTSENDPGLGLVGGDGSDVGSYEVVESVGSEDLKGFSVFSSGVVVRIIASFVGLFVLQTVVSVWVMGMGGSDEKERNVGWNENVYLGKWGGDNVREEPEMEARIAEIREMAREVRASERKAGLRSSEESVSDVFDDDGDELEVGSSEIQSGIVKEVDKRLSKLRKQSMTPMLNVNYLNKVGDNKNEGSSKVQDHKDDNDMLMFKIKRKSRSRPKIDTSDKPKGFGTIEGDHSAKEKPIYMDDEQRRQKMVVNGDGNETELGNDVTKMRGDVDSPIDEKKLELGSSSSLKASKKGFGSNGATKKSNKKRTTSKKSGNKNATKELNKGRGVVQDYSHVNPVHNGPTIRDPDVTISLDSSGKIPDQHSSTMSETHAMSHSKKQPDSDKLGNKMSMSRDDIWWFTLPYVLVIVMQTGPDGEEQQGFYTIRSDSDVKNRSYTPYIVGFEDWGDARNFSYLLELAFEDLPDAAIDVVPLSAKELKEAMEVLNKKVIVVKKGQLQLYAGQPLHEVESALRSLVK